MKLTQKKLEELYKLSNEKVKTDEEFARKLKENPAGALGELAECKLENDDTLKYIVKDTSYANTYVYPDFPAGEFDWSLYRQK